MKPRSTLLWLMLILFSTITIAGTTGNATLKGTYAFQMSGARIEWGYMGIAGWHNLCASNGSCSPCPKNNFCQNLTFVKTTADIIQFNGDGTGLFKSVTSINNGSGGPVAGTKFTYKVSGFTANMYVSGQTVAVSLGDYNASGIAQTVLILLTGDPDGSQTGVAILQ